MGRTTTLYLTCVLLLVSIRSSTGSQTLQKNRVYSSPIQKTTTLYDSLRTNFFDYAWPTDAGRIVTSVFAEYRSTHFHGGIDISTGDDTGYKVFASRDGYVERIIVGPTGYGKMVWLRHADGYTTTYAHLRNFNDALDALTKKEQIRLERYPVIIECKPNDFPVKKGDVIAYTGETGSGSPHLHFEIRDENKNFVNPLLCKQFTFQDDSLPRFFRIVVTPIGELSLINNSYQSHVIEFKIPLNESIALPETLHALGTFGFAVDVRDRINGSRFRNGVYSHQLFLDDSLIYSVRFDRAPSKEDFQIGLYYDFDLISDEGGKIAKLYMDSPNKLPFYQPQRAYAGIINAARLSEGVHTFTIVSSDFAGHSSQVSGSMLFSHLSKLNFVVTDSTLKSDLSQKNSLPQFRLFAKRVNQSAWKELDVPWEQSLPSKVFTPYDVVKILKNHELLPRFYFPRKNNLPNASAVLTHEVESGFIRILLRTNGAFTSTPSVAVVEGTSSRKLQVIPLDYNIYTATFRPLEPFSGKRTVIAECEINRRLQTLRDDFTVYPILPNKPAQISVDADKLQLVADSGSIYKPFFLDVQKNSGDASSRYTLLPRYTVLDGGIKVKMHADANQPNQAMYFRRRGKNWILESKTREGEYVVGKLETTLGELALLTDVKPPFISRLTLPTSYKKQPHVVSFTVRDNLSGVEYKELKLYIDNVFAIPEIDGEHRRAVHRFDEPLTRGPHTVTIRLKDRIGNAAEVRRIFKVR